MPTRLGNALNPSAATPRTRPETIWADLVRIAPHPQPGRAPRASGICGRLQAGPGSGRAGYVFFLPWTALSVVLLVRDGGWLLLVLAPYCVSYLAYRGAVSSAHAYGTALSTLVDLDRFAMYDELRIPSPPDTLTERERNRRLLELLSGDSTYLRYTTPQDSKLYDLSDDIGRQYSWPPIVSTRASPEFPAPAMELATTVTQHCPDRAVISDLVYWNLACVRR